MQGEDEEQREVNRKREGGGDEQPGGFAVCTLSGEVCVCGWDWKETRIEERKTASEWHLRTIMNQDAHLSKILLSRNRLWLSIPEEPVGHGNKWPTPLTPDDDDHGFGVLNKDKYRKLRRRFSFSFKRHICVFPSDFSQWDLKSLKVSLGILLLSLLTK